MRYDASPPGWRARRFPAQDHPAALRGRDRDESTGGAVDPTAVEAEIQANVQPVSLEDADLAGGVQLVERLRVFVPAYAGDLRAAFEETAADEVVYKGKVYTVEESRTWPTFTRATLLRVS